jgi:hypothetical protein
LVVLVLRLLFGPPMPAPVAQAAVAAPPAPQQQWISYDIPIGFKGITKPADQNQPLQINVALGGKMYPCVDTATGPPLDLPASEEDHITLFAGSGSAPHFIGVDIRSFTTAPHTVQLPFTVRIQPSLSGSASRNTYWTQSPERGGFLIWFLDRTAAHVLFTLVVEPKGDYRFVDGAVTGMGESSNGPREYAIARHSGVLGMSSNRQHIKVDWRPAGFRRDNGEAVPKYGIGFGNITFPEGELVLDITQ